MMAARIFICHNFDLTEVTRLDTQVFQHLCQRLQEMGAEVVTYTGRVSEENFLPFVYQELPTCSWFLVFQTPEVIFAPEIRTSVHIAQESVQQGQLRGVLRFLMHSDEIQELMPEWSAIPTVSASYDYPRAIEKLILAIFFNDEITAKAGPFAPPPPSPFTAPQTTPPLLLSPHDAQVYHQPVSPLPVYSSTGNQSMVQTAYNDPSSDRPPALSMLLVKLKISTRALATIFSVALVLAALLIVAFSTISPLRAFITGHHGQQNAPFTQNNDPSAGTISAATTGVATPTSRATIGVIQAGTTPSTGTPQASSTPGSTSTPKPAPTATPKPTPTATPKPVCPPTIQSGSTGSWVKTLQQELNARGMKGADGKTLSVDGDFGPNTQYAVKNWQTREKIAVDGIVGPITWHTLGNC